MSKIIKVRNKPVVRRCIQWDGEEETLAEIMKLMKDHPVPSNPHVFPDKTLRFDTIEGSEGCIVGAWIMRGNKGECYPIQDENLKDTYNFDIAEEKKYSVDEWKKSMNTLIQGYLIRSNDLEEFGYELEANLNKLK